MRSVTKRAPHPRTSVRITGDSSAPGTPCGAPRTASIGSFSSVTSRDRRRTQVSEVLCQLLFEACLERDHLDTTRCPSGLGSIGSVSALGYCELTDQGERHLSLGIDVVDLHVDLLAEGQHAFHAIDAFATAELRNVKQAVTSGKDIHERTELGDVHHLARVNGAHLCFGRVDDDGDPAPGLFDGRRFLGADRDDTDHTVVVDCDVCAGLCLKGVYDLALRTDYLADPVDGDLERDDLRGVVCDLRARSRD